MTRDEKLALEERPTIDNETREALRRAQKEEGVIALREYKENQWRVRDNMLRLRALRLGQGS